MQTRRRRLLTKVTILSRKPGRIRIIVTCPEVDQPGVLVDLLAGEDSSVDAVAQGFKDQAPRVEKVTGFGASGVVGQVGGAPQGVMVVVLAAATAGQAV